MLHQMKLTDRQKRGDVQHLLARNFSRRNMSIPHDEGDITIPVPQFPPTQQTSPSQEDLRKRKSVSPPEKTLSIGELSVEPRVLGGQLIDLSSPHPEAEAEAEEEETDAPKPAIQPSNLPTEQKDELSDTSSEPEEQSVRTPLLEGEAPTTLPVNTQPSIKRYDEMFSEQIREDEIPLGATADTILNQP